jgi:Reverse transcriptase (RNA-dependent DNA polymerase)/Endonuclease-reverse transcriptase
MPSYYRQPSFAELNLNYINECLRTPTDHFDVCRKSVHVNVNVDDFDSSSVALFCDNNNYNFNFDSTDNDILNCDLTNDDASYHDLTNVDVTTSTNSDFVKPHLSIYFQNVNRARQKTEELFLSASECDYDVIMLVETNFNDNIQNTEIFDSRFVVFRCDRSSLNSTRANGGGVLIAINRKHKSEILNVAGGELVEQMWVRLSVSNKQFVICCVYLPPSCNSDTYGTFIDSTESIFNLCDVNDNILVCGDFNIPNVRWVRDETELLPFDVSTDKDSAIVDGMASLGLNQINDIPNVRNVFLDLFFSNFSDDISVYDCEFPLLKLDIHHKAYELILDIDELHFKTTHEPVKQYNFSNAKFSEILNHLNSVDWDSAFRNANVDSCVDIFYDQLNYCIENFVPLISSPPNIKRHPWQTRELINLENKKNKAFKTRRMAQFKFLRTKYHDLHRRCYSAYLRNIENGIKINPKKFFEYANHKTKVSGYPSSMRSDFSTADSPQDVAELFATFFESVYVDDDGGGHVDTSNRINCGFSTLNFTMNDIETAIDGLDGSKGPGDDGIPPNFIKHCVNGLKTPLLHIFNLSLSKGIFPNKWKKSFLIPIFKSGKRDEVGNYRGVAILSCFAKIFEVLTYSHIFFAVKSSLPTNQHGFVSGRSTVTNLIEFTSFILNSMESGFQIDSIYTDFSKAFDKVNHRLLILKLSCLGFGGNFLNWIASYLTGRRQYVKIGNSRSRMIPVKSGVPQGSHLGPLLFIIFVSDVDVCFKFVRYLMYADDLKIYFKIRNVADYNRVQSELHNFNQWCSNNKMILNLSKCKIISFSRSSSIHDFQYTLSGSVLDRVESISDLGVILDSKLTFVAHIDATINKANKKLGYIKRIGRDFRDIHTLKSLYSSFVRSILEYATVIWNPYYRNHLDRIERVQRRFMRFALRNLRWNRDLPLPPYCNRCRLIDIDCLYVRRRIACVLFVYDVLSHKYDCPSILSQMSFLVYRRNVRSRVMFREDQHRTNYGVNAPLDSAIRQFNRFSNNFDFGCGRWVFKKKIRQTLLFDPCTCV